MHFILVGHYPYTLLHHRFSGRDKHPFCLSIEPMLRRRVVLLFSNSPALESPGLLKRYGLTQHREGIYVCEALNDRTAAIQHYFCQILHFGRWPPTPSNTQEQAVEPFQNQKLSQNIFDGSLSLYEDVTRKEEIFGLPIFNADQYQIFISF